MAMKMGAHITLVFTDCCWSSMSEPFFACFLHRQVPEISEHNPRGTIQKINVIIVDTYFLNSAPGLCSEMLR